MYNRLSIFGLRSIGNSLSANHNKYAQISRSISIFAFRYRTTQDSSQCYIMNYEKCKINWERNCEYSTNANETIVPIVTYEEVKDLPNHPEKTLIDVREPDELKETGIIPTAINIPCKNFEQTVIFLRFWKKKQTKYMIRLFFTILIVGEVTTALSLTDRQFKTKYNRNKPDFSDEIIFHCRIGRRSENAAIAASKLGYTK